MASNTNFPPISSAADKIKAVSSYDSNNGAVSFDNNVDYQARINAAVAAGDMTSAAAAERQRNAKIDATGSPYQKTNNYSQYLTNGTQNSGNTYYDKNVDYQAEINKATAAGDMQTAALLERQRNAKISGEGITDYQQTREHAAYNPSASKTYNGQSYNSELDYMAGMMQAVQNGDLETARKLEQTRNAKIDGDGLDYEKTNLFGTQEQKEQPTEQPQVVYVNSGGSSGGSGNGYRYSDVLQNPNDLVSAMIEQLNSWREAAAQQSALKRDYAVERGVNELQRALEDAQLQFQTQRDQVSKDERKGLDNSALYAEARGDRGGIGQEQYNLIQSSAAQNRLAVSQAQTKLSTDTARQIADLRAQGEFSKADDLLSLAQTYLSQLTQLQQWGADYSLDFASFQESIRQWEAEYELQKAALMGTLNGAPTLDMQKYQTSKQQWQDEFNWNKHTWQNEFDQSNKRWQSEFDMNKSQMSQSEKEWQAKMGMTLLDAGILPSDTQLAAIGMTKAQAQDYIIAQKLQSSASKKSSSTGSSGGGGGKTTSSKSTGGGGTPKPDSSVFTGSTYEEAKAYLKKHAAVRDAANELMTQSAWESMKKNVMFKPESLSPAIRNYNTYADYIQGFVRYMTGGSPM
ncbi:MAG: hypothetical protein ACI3VM_08955 [Oscillospiraceae bacterium]